MMAWEPQQRRTSSFVVLGLALAIVLGGIAVWFFLASTPDWVYWTLVGALALVLAFMVVLLFVQPRAASAPAQETAAATSAEPAESPAYEAPAAAFEPRILTLRCGDCGTIFDVTDTGERPLYHTCPGCGAEGALRDPVEPPAAAAAPEAPAEAGAASPEAYYAPPAEYSAPPVVAPAPPPPAPPAPTASAAEAAPATSVKKLKLRCGGCKEVFSIEDTGERPLKRACPHCGRIGKIG